MSATIKDVAKKANVSYTTVSRALNNKYGVKKETRDRIVKAAAEMGYTCNAIARGLVKKKTNTIGLILPDITNPFFPEIAMGIEDGAHAKGYSVFLCNTNYDPEREAQYLKHLAEKRVDGIILVPASNERSLELNKISESGIPIVYACSYYLEGDRSYVAIDDERGGFLATRHLVEQGYSTIAYIGAKDETVKKDERLVGYKQALKKFGIPARDRLIYYCDHKMKTGHDIINKMISKKEVPRAIFAANDLLAIGVIQGAKELGLSVPGDIAVVGFDDIPFASLPEIQLTTISQPKQKMGELSINILLDIIFGNEQNTRRTILEPELVIRKSSC
jgi:LacI family transcriptional regulator